MPAPQEVKLGRTAQATNWRLGHHHPQAKQGLAVALNLAVGPTWSSPIPQGFIQIVKALFWADSAEKQKRPAPLSQATLLPVPKVSELSQEQLPDSRASPGAQLLLGLAERAHQNPAPLGHPQTELRAVHAPRCKVGVCAFVCGGGKPAVGKEDVSRAANEGMLMAFQWGHLLARHGPLGLAVVGSSGVPTFQPRG